MKNTKHIISIVAVAMIAVAALFAFGRGGEASPPAPQYRVLLRANTMPQLELLLNTQSSQGWKLHTYGEGVVIFVK